MSDVFRPEEPIGSPPPVALTTLASLHASASEPGERLLWLQQVEREAHASVLADVVACRGAGWSWQYIGALLGVDGAQAQRRFGLSGRLAAVSATAPRTVSGGQSPRPAGILRRHPSRLGAGAAAVGLCLALLIGGGDPGMGVRSVLDAVGVTEPGPPLGAIPAVKGFKPAGP